MTAETAMISSLHWSTLVSLQSMLSVQRTFVTLERALLPVTDRTMLDVLLAQFALKVPRGTSKYLEDVTNKRSTHTGDVSHPARHSAVVVRG